MLSKDLENLGKSFLAFAEIKNHKIVIDKAHAENFARVLHDYALQAQALESRPIHTAEIVDFKPRIEVKNTAPENSGGDAA